MELTEEDYLLHYGILRRSGRYPWGSGKDQHQRNKMFLDDIKSLREKGLTDKQIVEGYSTDEFPFTQRQLRNLETIAKNEQKQSQINMALRLQEKGMSPSEIGRQMGVNESTVRSLVAPGRLDKAAQLNSIADLLRREVEEKEFLDVGAQVERALPLGDNPGATIGVPKDKFATALTMLEEEGYHVRTFPLLQQTTGESTNMKVLVKPGVSQKEAWENRHNVQQIQSHSEDNGRTNLGIQYPKSLDSKRVGINYAEDGGSKADGVIYVRPGVPDVSIGQSQYAQVRVMVDDSHYLKGMAVYKDGLPKGVDVVFNTNKSNTGNKLDVMKPLKRNTDTGEIDKDNPFGAAIKAGGQMLEQTPTGVKVTSVMNRLRDEGDWDDWNKALPSQMLSKQHPKLIEQQLQVTYERRQREFDEIMSITNPTVKRTMLMSFADSADSAAVHLQAANMPRQATRVIMPVPEMKVNEVFAPAFKDGERVALIRYPHGGTFEIPELTVNNRNPAARKLLTPHAKDAIGINHKVAERLSGADFDGDHVVVIPNNRGLVTSTPALKGLQGFDPRAAYPPYDGMKTVDGGTYRAATKDVDYGKDKDGKTKQPRSGNMQTEMGKISNLITDMSLAGADEHELVRAVRHSMVIIDAEKHMLDYKESFRVNEIPALKEKYQGSKKAGASTLISQAKAPEWIPQQKLRKASQGGPINPETGEKVYVPTGKMVRDKKTGKMEERKMKVDRLSVTKDAHDLSSGTQQEILYADYSNKTKAMANAARKEYLATKPTQYNPSANKAYRPQVESLLVKLDEALKNAPLERQAQVLAGKVVSQKLQQNPEMSSEHKQRVRNQALAEMRVRTGATKHRIQIEPSEWEAIQAGAISNTKLEEILRNSDVDAIKKLATPRAPILMTSSAKARAKAMMASGFTQAEIAEQLGVSVSTLKSGLSGE